MTMPDEAWSSSGLRTSTAAAAAAALAATTASPAVRGQTPPLQRERSREELEIARQLIEHSQNAVTANATAGLTSTASNARPQTESQTQTQAHVSPSHQHQHQHQHQAPQHEPPGPNSNRDVMMAGIDDDHPGAAAGERPVDERHDMSDINVQDAVSARSGSIAIHAGTPPLQSASQTPVAATVGGQACSNCGTTKTPLWRRSPAGEVICNACGLYYKARQQMRPVGLKRGSTAANRHTDGQPHDRATPSSLQSQATYVSADLSVNGTCPGGGRCNGTGGHQGCNGCPAYNNRVSKTAQVALQQTVDSDVHASSPAQGNRPPVAASVVVACQNCGTTITPLWRRDEAGNTICNACGLYHKLHGAHRPVHMKKAEIKRRKRVVPLDGPHITEHGSPHAHEIMVDDDNLSRPSLPPSDPQTLGPTDPDLSPSRFRGPIPVDFTSFRWPQSQASPSVETEWRNGTSNGNGGATTIPRKRSITKVRNSDGQLSPPRRSPAPPRSRSPPEHIDPSLSHPSDNIGSIVDSAIHRPGPSQSHGRGSLSSSTMSPTALSAKEARRAELQREADLMRSLLMQKERELAELGDEG